MALRLQVVPAAHGALWLRQGFRVFVRRPLAFASLLTGFFLVSLLVSVLLPYLGSILALMALPLLGLGFMVATQATLQAGTPQAAGLVAPLRALGTKGDPRRAALWKLCALYGIAALAVVLVSEQAFGDVWDKVSDLYASTAQPTPEQMEAVANDPRFLYGFGLRALLLAALSVPFWHAPALVLWGDQGVAQALFSSTLACWRCKGAFLVYGLLWIGLMILLVSLTTLVFAAMGMAQLAPLAAVPLAIVASTVFYVSLYFTFVDSFAPVVEASAEKEMA